MAKTRYGEQPLKKIKGMEISIEGMKSNGDAQHIQYNLMLNEHVLYARINFPTKSGFVVFHGIDAKKLLELINKMKTYSGKGGYKAKLIKEMEMDYEKGLLSNMYKL